MSDTQADTNKREAPLVIDTESDNDYALKSEETGADVWIRVHNIAVCVHRTDEGVVVDLWGGPEEEPLGSTYAYFAEAEEEDETIGQEAEEAGLARTIPITEDTE